MSRSDRGSRFLWILVGIAAVAAAARSIRKRAGRRIDGGTSPEPIVPQSGEAAASPEDSGGAARRWIRRFDHFQRRVPWLAFPIGVVKKFGEDKAGYLAVLVAYFGFFSVFPLMLAFTSILGYVIRVPDAQRRFSDAAADQIPVIGNTIRNTAGRLSGSWIAIVIGTAVALWAGLRIVDAMQNALNEVWDLPRVVRPKLMERRLKGILMLGLIGGGLVASIAASNVAAIIDVIPGLAKLGIWATSALVSVLLYLLSFQLLTDTKLPWKDLWPGAIFAGIAWWLLQTFGSVIIINQQQGADAAYGEFAAIIALLVFFFLAAQFSILGAEISVVKARRLWPRSFTRGEFTEADVAVFEYLAASTKQDESYAIRIEPLVPVAHADPVSDPSIEKAHE